MYLLVATVEEFAVSGLAAGAIFGGVGRCSGVWTKIEHYLLAYGAFHLNLFVLKLSGIIFVLRLAN
jgi:hypothetical protein